MLALRNAHPGSRWVLDGGGAVLLDRSGTAVAQCANLGEVTGPVGPPFTPWEPTPGYLLPPSIPVPDYGCQWWQTSCSGGFDHCLPPPADCTDPAVYCSQVTGCPPASLQNSAPPGVDQATAANTTTTIAGGAGPASTKNIPGPGESKRRIVAKGPGAVHPGAQTEPDRHVGSISSTIEQPPAPTVRMPGTPGGGKDASGVQQATARPESGGASGPSAAATLPGAGAIPIGPNMVGAPAQGTTRSAGAGTASSGTAPSGIESGAASPGTSPGVSSGIDPGAASPGTSSGASSGIGAGTPSSGTSAGAGAPSSGTSAGAGAPSSGTSAGAGSGAVP